MGEVFKVWDEETHALRFIKRVQINSKDHASLRREAQIYSKLMNRNFAHVVTVHEVERDEAYMGLVLDFAEGGTLQRHVPQVGLASSKEVKSIATQIGTGLRELHHLDVVHRDLKPANVLRHNAAWKLADFGIAKDTGVHGTTTFKGHFTPGYAAPEQINSTEATPSADVYSFGKVITLMLTGGTDPDQIRFPDWQYLVRRCTDRNPDERPSASEVLKEISRL